MTKHPAPYSPAVLAAMAARIPDHSLVLDPFAGTGLIHTLTDLERDVRTIGVEIEPEWATMHGDTLRGDATDLPGNWSGRFDVIATSPCYGNRMADHHEARDDSHRITYRHRLGRMPSPGSAAILQWGDAYRTLHAKAWQEAIRVTRPGGRFLLNVKDHVRGGQIMPVSAWHLTQCRLIGWQHIETVQIPAPGMRFGQNGGARIDYELLYVMEKVA